MNHFKSNTILASLVRVVRDTLEDYDVDPEEVLSAAGIDLPSLKNPLNRIPVTTMHRLWDVVEETTGDPYIALAISRRMSPSTFFALGISAFASENILEAFRVVSKAASIILTGVHIRMYAEGDTRVFELTTKRGYPDLMPRGVETAIAGVLQVLRKYMALEVKLDLITFRHEAPGDPLVFEEWFGCPVIFNESRDAVYVTRLDQLLSGFPAANTALREANEVIIQDYQSKLKGGSLSNQISDEISLRLENGEPFDQKTVARAMCMSERKMQSALKGEGITFKNIVDRIRYRKAIYLLTGKNMPVTRIATQLGFRETSSFTRAFKRWTGKTPRGYLSAR